MSEFSLYKKNINAESEIVQKECKLQIVLDIL